MTLQLREGEQIVGSYEVHEGDFHYTVWKVQVGLDKIREVAEPGGGIDWYNEYQQTGTVQSGIQST